MVLERLKLVMIKSSHEREFMDLRMKEVYLEGIMRRKVYDAEKEENISIIWLQAIDEPTLALPVMKPEFVYETYDPVVEDELLKSLGDDIQDDNIRVYCALTVPQDITKMTINLKAPIIVDFDTMKGIQLIADNSEYQVRYPIYDILKKEEN